MKLFNNYLRFRVFFANFFFFIRRGIILTFVSVTSFIMQYFHLSHSRIELQTEKDDALRK